MIFVDTNVFMYAVGREHPLLGARDLLHVACCTRRSVKQIKTFDRALAAVLPGA